MSPDAFLTDRDGQESIRIGGYLLPREDFNLAKFLRDDLGTTWLHAGGMPSTKRLVELLDIKPGMKVLDLGCGVGSATRYVARNSKASVVGVDLDPDMIQRARLSSRRSEVKNIQYESMDVTDTRFPDRSFDRVIVQSVACFNDKATLFGEVARLLKPGGLMGLNEVTWLQPPTEKIERVMCATICETFHGALLAEDWIRAMSAAGLVDPTCEKHPFNAATPYQILREEGVLNTAKIMWRVLTNPEINMRLGAMSEFFNRCPEYFSYGLYTARQPGLD
ncbi:MAG: hypothetical protein B7Y41_02940 [Hydrogenophilales bacterium 28-61-23]|nr:MAG: hypothetical protein B7Y41_02940 [Hydrogenophilales bacterium 28-61-23]